MIGSAPNCRPECILNSDCPASSACVNQKCVDPCPGTCGSNSECRVVNHSPVCSCATGYTGNAFNDCRPVPVVGKMNSIAKPFCSFFFLQNALSNFCIRSGIILHWCWFLMWRYFFFIFLNDPFFFTYLYFEEKKIRLKLLFWVITVLKIIISKSIFFSAIRDFAFYSFFWQMLWLLVFKFFKNPAFESEVFYMLSLLDETLKDFLNLVLNYAFQSSL